MKLFPLPVLARAFAASVAMAMALAGCAGGASNPVFNASVKKAHLFAPGELDALRLPGRFSSASGEVRYCASGMPDLIQSRKRAALAAIADACGGEDRYGVIDEIQADATGTFMGVDVKCIGNAGRAIYFSCKRAAP